MNYPYYPQQVFPYYGLNGSQAPQNSDSDHFRGIAPPASEPQQFNDSAFQSFEPYQFDHPSHPQPAFDLPQEPFLKEPTIPVDAKPLATLTSPPISNNGHLHDQFDNSSDANQPSFPSHTSPSGSGENGDDGNMDQDHGPSSSEEKDNSLVTPQSRRKAQNRAAQRAFRERKERRVRDLEQELTEYKQNLSSLLEDNESLKRQMAKVATENEILRATSQSARCHRSPSHDPEPTTTGPMRYSPTDYSQVGEGNKPAHRVKVNEVTGQKYLDASATWDVIVSRLNEKGLKLDVQDIYERLKGHAQCDGTGPVIEEAHVLKAIDESLAAGNDELI
ncbi:hypothetical protein FQN57_001415 [Myotisia sp. PD_48]|nr:hypothetical protein FQN57_001415 [Myotisia sp. PD_48]